MAKDAEIVPSFEDLLFQLEQELSKDKKKSVAKIARYWTRFADKSTHRAMQSLGYKAFRTAPFKLMALYREQFTAWLKTHL